MQKLYITREKTSFMKRVIILLITLSLIAVSSTLVFAHECGDAGGSCIHGEEACPEGYSESSLSCAPALVPRCCMPPDTECVDSGYMCKSAIQGCGAAQVEVSLKCPDHTVCCKQINPCEEAGYSCQWHSCGSHRERVYELDCPQEPESGYLCCKEIVNEDVIPKLEADPTVVEEMDIVRFSVELPYFMDCTTYLTSPSGVEVLEGEGGCGPSGQFMSFSTLRIEQIFGELEPGKYTLRIVARKEGKSDIELEADFNVNIASPGFKYNCELSGGSGVCRFLDVDYEIEYSGCYEDIDFKVVYGSREEEFMGIDVGTVVTLKDNTKIKLTSSPCSVDLIKFMLTSEVKTICGNGVCEVEEDKFNCASDCEDLNEMPEYISEDPELIVECTTGCLYKRYCVSAGVRVGDEYCNLDGEFVVQKERDQACENSFECKSGICADDICVEKGLLVMFLDFLRGIWNGIFNITE